MKLQIPCIAVAAILVAACGKKEESQPEAPVSPEPAPAVDASDPTKPEYWINVRYEIDRVAPGHKQPTHVVLGGGLEIYGDGNGGYKLRTESSAGGEEWRREYQEVVLKYNAEGVRFCSPKDEQTDTVEFMKQAPARRFRADVAVELHDLSENHKEHIIEICPVDPSQTGGKKEIQIRTDFEGVRHDGVSHGAS